MSRVAKSFAVFGLALATAGLAASDARAQIVPGQGLGRGSLSHRPGQRRCGRDGAGTRHLSASRHGAAAVRSPLVADRYTCPLANSPRYSIQKRAAGQAPRSAAAQKAVVRDNVAGFYYHPFLGTEPLRRLVDGLRHEGYRFVSTCAVLKG